MLEFLKLFSEEAPQKILEGTPKVIILGAPEEILGKASERILSQLQDFQIKLLKYSACKSIRS